MSFVTVTVVTVVFLRVSVPFIIYITIYILISYKVFRRGCNPLFLIVITVIVIDSAVHSLFLYQATQCHAEFVIHAEGIALQGEVFSQVHTGTVNEVNPESWTQLKGSNEKGI